MVSTAWASVLEPRLGQAFTPEPPVEALDEGVLHQLARVDVVERDAPAVRPLVQGEAGELRAVVALMAHSIPAP